MKLSVFADEISPDFDRQLEAMKQEGLSYLELRSIGGKGVLNMKEEELEEVKVCLDGHDIKISGIASPIGKYPISEDFKPHLERFRRAVEIARFFETNHIRVFSYYIPKGEDPAQYRDEVLRRMSIQTEEAQKAGLVLLNENEKGLYGDKPQRCLDVLSAINSKNLRAVFDFANFVQAGVKPYTEAFPLLADYIECIHIKDALFSTGKVVPIGEGDGEAKEVLMALKNRGFEGFLILEPHLVSGGESLAEKGPQQFHRAAKALKHLLEECGIEF